jgi:peptidoglycan/LPS O-acetylase OafA/YrhL
VLLIVTAIQLVRHNGYTLQTVLAKLTPFVFALQNYMGPWDIITQTWSLAVEEHFYLVLPILLLYLSCHQKRFTIWQTLPVVAIAILLICNLFKIMGSVTGAFPVNGFNTHVRMDALFFGVFLNYLHGYGKNQMRPIKSRPQSVFVIGLLLVTLRYCLPFTPFSDAISFTLLYLGYGLCLLAVMNLNEGSVIDRLMKSRLSKIVAWIGVYSYSIYLWHFVFAGPFVIAKVIPLLPDAFKFAFGMSIYLVLAILNGVIFARLIDVPVLAFRNKFFPSRTAIL